MFVHEAIGVLNFLIFLFINRGFRNDFQVRKYYYSREQLEK